MPAYDFECTACGQRFEFTRAMTDSTLPPCPACQGLARKLFSPGVGFFLVKKPQGSCSMKRESGQCHKDAAGHSCCSGSTTCGSGDTCEGDK
jgi:putative FmdB family regulatory protein